MDEHSPRIRNSVTVESPYGLRSFTLRLGDISKADDPVLAVPTHSNPNFQLTGAVLSTVATRFGVDFGRLEPLLVPRRDFGTYRVLDRGNFPGHEILLVRIPGHASTQIEAQLPLESYHKALWTLFGSMAALELQGDALKSLALPLLGATRGYNIADLMLAILEHSLTWLKASHFMQAVNFYLFDEKSIDEWIAAMDNVLGRKLVDSAQNDLIGALRDEILARLTTGWRASVPDPWQVCLNSLHQFLQQQRIPLERVATDARTFVECVVESLLKAQGASQLKGSLDQNIKELRNKKQTAPWIVSHFDCLRSFGNAAVHLAEAVPTIRLACGRRTSSPSWRRFNASWHLPRHETEFRGQKQVQSSKPGHHIKVKI